MNFTIYGELTDLNTYIKALNGNRWAGNNIKQVETTRCATEARKARLGSILGEIQVHFMWYSRDKRKDIDNIAFAKKFILDGMVQSGVIANDSRKYVTGFSDEFFIDKKNPRVEVIIKKVLKNKSYETR